MITIRPATADDVETLDTITEATENPGGPPPAGARDAQLAYLRNIISRGRVAIAEADGDPVGFGAAVRTGRATHLADMFVLPESQGHGIGRRLLTEVFADDWPRTTFGSSDPRAVPIYIRAGMDAHWPNLYLAGDPARLPVDDGELSVEPAAFEVIAAHEADWSGADREPDLEYRRSLPGVTPVAVRRAGRIVGVGIGRNRTRGPGRWVHGAMAAPGEDGPAVLLAVLRATLRADGVDFAGGCIPGPSPLVRVLLESGFRIADRDTFLASDPGVVDPLREIVNTGVL
jgi:GNAT superfamily N-acetyltransferase